MSTPTGYRMLLPEGWLQIPTAPDLGEQALDRYVQGLFSSLPRDSVVQLRRDVEQHWMTVLRDARQAGAVSLQVNVAPIAGLPVAASSTVVLVAPVPGSPDLPAAQMAEELGGGSTTVTIGMMEGVRRRRTVPINPDAPLATGPTTRLEVLLPVPEVGGWALVAFATSVVDDGADAMVELFDAIVGTFRWVSA